MSGWNHTVRIGSSGILVRGVDDAGNLTDTPAAVRQFNRAIQDQASAISPTDAASPIRGLRQTFIDPAGLVDSSTQVKGNGVPTGDLPGWDLIFVDDFNRTTLNPVGTSYWTTYDSTGATDGPAGLETTGWYLDTHVVCPGDSTVVLKGYEDAAKPGRISTGAMGLWHGPNGDDVAPPEHVKLECRIKIDKDPVGYGATPGDRTVGYAWMLWPFSDLWPQDGEIDWAEDSGGDRIGTTATYHYDGGGGVNTTLPQRVLSGIDLSQWHRMGVEWTPGRLDFTIDGAVWGTLSDPAIETGAKIPIFQSGSYAPAGRLPPGEINIYIDWVALWAQA